MYPLIIIVSILVLCVILVLFFNSLTLFGVSVFIFLIYLLTEEFRQQVRSWKINPERGKIRFRKKEHETYGISTICNDISRPKNSKTNLESAELPALNTKVDHALIPVSSAANNRGRKGGHRLKQTRSSRNPTNCRRFLLDLRVANDKKINGPQENDNAVYKSLQVTTKEPVASPTGGVLHIEKDNVQSLEPILDDDQALLKERTNDVLDQKQVLDVKESEMASSNISQLIQEGQSACQAGKEAVAKRKALQAIVGIDIEKDKLLGGQRTKFVNEQQLGDWYGGCSFILHQIGEEITATRCFYTATIFDPSWDVNNHKAVSDVLWASLVFTRDPDELASNCQALMGLLSELDELAKLAEFRQKWRVCVAADGDINKVYSFLMKEEVIGDELMSQPGRRVSLWRSARCFLRMGMHDDARKLCSTILQYACNYDDSEAFEIWAYSLCYTGDFDIALQKCELALKYCKNDDYRQRLEAFGSEIKRKMDSDVNPINTGSFKRDTKQSRNEGKQRNASGTRQNRKHKQLKGMDCSNRYPRSSASAPDMTNGNESSSSPYNTPREQTPDEEIIYERTRNASVSSVSTIDSEVMTDVLRLQSDEEESIEYTDFCREETAEGVVSFDTDPEDDGMTEEMTFYEQSMRFYLENDDSTEYSSKTDSVDKLLKYGIKLNISYLHQFQDKHPDIIKRDQFYTEFLDKDQLKQKILQNPKKYVRCIIQIEGSHEAVCTPVDTSESMHVIEISGRSKVGQAFNEDEVVVEILDDKDVKGKRFGKVIGVWNRQRHKDTKHPVFICTLDDMESNLVRPMCRTIPKLHVIDREISQKYKTVNAKRYKIETYDYDEAAGMLCNPKIVNLNPAEQKSYIFLVAFISWSPRHIYPRGAIIRMLPPGLTESSGLMILNLQHEVPALYRKATVDQVASLSRRLGDEPTDTLLQGRKNLIELNTFTIDPPDSKDLDDALSVESIDGGYKVGVHISDVATYVNHNSPLDEESMQRAITFYPGIRRPRNMLPEPFSTNICSLLPNKTRLTMSVFFFLTETGRPMQMEGSNFEICKSYIRSSNQLTYDEAQRIISSQKGESMDKVTKDIKTMFKIATEVRKLRLGEAMFALDTDWDEAEQGESASQTAEAHFLVEEFMVMANKRVANWLLRHRFKGYSQCVPLRCQPPPSKENIEECLQKNDSYLDILLRLQGKQIGPKKPSFHDKLSPNDHGSKAKSVMVTNEVWRAMQDTPNSASEYIRKDELHPLQLTIYQQWLSIQERAGYRCSGSIKGEEDGKHYSLDIYPYTHFTSPIRRYVDLIVQRLIHAAFKSEPCPYKRHEIDSICIHINSTTKRAKEYEKGCRALQKAIELRTNPKMLSCFVDDVSDRSVSLCSPWLQFVPKQQRELSFNLLDMGYKPEVYEDPDTKWNKVGAMWRKRLFDFQVKPKYKPSKDNMYKLNPHRGVVFLPCHEWARMLKATIEEHNDDLVRAIANASISRQHLGYEDVTTECQNPLKIQPNTKFEITFSRGQQLKIQMSAAPNKGIITPKPVLYSMTNNVKFCLQHIENPVLHLYRYVTRPTCDQYPNVKTYLERWLPIILMEAATGIVRNEESCCINNISIQFLEDRKGRFSLGLAECEIRNIELSGTAEKDDDDTSLDETTGSFDWLCLKTEVPNLTERERSLANRKDVQNFKPVWVGHAAVINVTKKKNQLTSDGKICITFRLHERSPALPPSVQRNAKFSIEILKKSEVDRRTETFVKELQSQSDSLAAKVALNKRIPDFDRSRAHIASLRHNQDLVFVANQSDPVQRRTVLPRNNAKQQEAINKALTSRFSLIQGPPGTGKTYTGIKLMYLFDRINDQLSKEGQPRKQVLFCGPSNKSVDLVAKWMLTRMEHFKPNFIRVYGRSIESIDFPIPGRTFLSKRSTRGSHTDPALKVVSLHHLIRQKGKKYAEEINAKDRLFKQHNYEPMPTVVKEYVHTVREASIEEIRQYDVILCTTAVGANPKVLEATNVYQVIVDEAGMCPEPQCLVPIIATKAEQVVLIGDHKQLRPVIMCKEAAKLGLETSLFERYATTNLSKNVQFTRLEEQYRMNPEICRFPSKMFYDSSLITMPGIWRDETLRIWPKDVKGVYPHVLVHVEGEERVLSVATEDGNEQSRSNNAEIEHVIATYKYMKREVPNESVQILSQYNAQCSEIKKKLKQEGVEDYDEVVSTVVSSQGGEWNYVIFSTVRSLPEYKIEKNPTLGWCKHNLGFITDRNQVNVALTRARKGLIIIGNKELLVCDYVWKRLIQHYEHRGCLKTPAEFPPKSIRKSRQQIMDEAYVRTYRRYGDSIYEKGEATSYEGAFDEEYDEDDMWRPRVAQRPTRR